MNNKGFSLVELVVTIALISLISIIFIISIGNSFGLSSEKSYEIMKNSIITQVENYVYECDNELVNCEGDYIWKDFGNTKTATFNLSVMKKYAYLSENEFINPITNEEISNCLIINVKKDEYANTDVSLDDSNCKK